MFTQADCAEYIGEALFRWMEMGGNAECELDFDDREDLSQLVTTLVLADPDRRAKWPKTLAQTAPESGGRWNTIRPKPERHGMFSSGQTGVSVRYTTRPSSCNNRDAKMNKQEGGKPH